MQTRVIAAAFLVGLMTAGLSSCSVEWRASHGYPVKTMPPGQVKKVTGSQSAAPYAPGQQKKKNKKQTQVIVVPVPVPVPSGN